MPGGHVGGGSRGGGFHGGGGIRGMGGPSFRSSTPFATPFGRTGANRTITHSPSGPYIHTPITHPGPSYYPRYYHRWWSPWRSYGYGYGYRRSGGIAGCCVCIVFLVIFASVFAYSGIFNGWSFGSSVNYYDTETLYYNDYWYESEYLSSGSQITFNMQSYSAVVTFLITDTPLTSLPTTTIAGNETGNFTLPAKAGSNEYFQYEEIYLKSGSSLGYNFNSSNQVSFFIANGNNFNKWYQGSSSASFYRTLTGVTTGTGSYSVAISQDYYVVWHNPYAISTQVNYSISYTAASVYDYSSTLYHVEAVTTVGTTTVTVPNDGNWYFYIYFDPLDSSAYSTTVHFDVTYQPTTSAGFSPFNAVYIIPIIAIVVTFIAIIAIAVSRSRARARTQSTSNVTPVMDTPTQPPASSPVSQPMTQFQPQPSQPGTLILSSVAPPPKTSPATCFSCGAELTPGAQFCVTCGRKQQGRQMGMSSTITPASAKTCSVCGVELEPGTKYCGSCGTPVQ